MLAEIIASLVLIVISVIWIAEGLRLGLWIPGVSAGSGFVPAAFAALTLVSSIYVIYAAVKKHKASAVSAADAEASKADKESSKTEEMKSLIPIGFCIGGIFCLQLFGLVITVAAISFLWMRFVSKMEMKKTLLFTIAITLFIYLVFEFWLKIPFPGDIIRL